EDDKSGFINFVSRNLNEEEPLIEWSKVEIPTEYEMIVPYHILPPVPDDATETRRLLDKVVVLRLNGDLGTAMGSDGPKSLIEVRHNYNFIELVVIQIENLNWKYGCNVPLVLLNPFNTHVETLKSQYPCIAAEDFTPLPCKGGTSKDGWYSPGHGEVFQCLRNSGMLDEFISQEKEILFFANIDNLGALLDFRILKNMVENQKEFCMELTPKTSHDQMTGTHISYEGKVQFIQRAQVPEKHVKEFDSTEKLKLFHTNTMWMNLNVIKRLADAENPNVCIEVHGTKVVQFETVADDAIKFFDRAIGINVPRARYLPLRTTADLFLYLCDIYTLVGYVFKRKSKAKPLDPIIEFGLKVTGEVRFGSRVVLKGKVSIAARAGGQLQIPDKKVIEHKEINGPADLCEFTARVPGLP
ncbi:hypothetical protein V6Z12_A07G191500, partial [Gossypium hirsutum]